MGDVRTFKDQTFTQRFAQMGDLAESKCAEWLEAEQRGYVPFGLNRPPIRMSMLPARIRHMPDFLTARGLIECKGFGRDQILKVKIEDFNCWNFWNDVHPLELFFYDSHKDRHICVNLGEFRLFLSDSRVTLGSFDNDTKPYFAIPAEVVFQ